MNNTKRQLGIFVTLAATFALALVGIEAAAEDSTAVVTEQVLDHHLKAFGDGDMEAILSDYTEESVMLTPNGPLKGHEQLEPAFAGLFEEFAKPGASFTIQQRIIEGNVAYIVWTAETADNVYEQGTDTFVVRDGKIAVQSFTPKVTPKGN